MRGGRQLVNGRGVLLMFTTGAMVASVLFASAAVAETTCDRTEDDGYTTLTVNIATDQTIAVRFFGSMVDVSDDVSADATDFVPQQEGLDAACIQQGEIERMVVNGTSGGETLKVIEWGTSMGETPGSEIQTTVDLGDGSDTLEFMSADTNNNGVADPTPRFAIALGSAAEGGGIVADQGPTTEGNFLTNCVDSFSGGEINTNGFGFDCTDLHALNADHIVITGGTTKDGDAVDAQGDFDDSFVDGGTHGVVDPSDPQLPGTADHEELDGDGGLDNDDNEPNGGSLGLPLVVNLNAGKDVIAPGDADDVIDAGPGRDLVDYAEATEGLEIDLAAGSATGGGIDSIVSFEGAVGTVLDDTILGSKVNNLVMGFCGDDRINGGSKHDALIGDWTDFFGTPLCDETAGSEDDPGDALPDYVSGNDKLKGQGGGDFIKGLNGNDKLSGGGGRDGLNGGAGADKGNGGSGRDRCRKIEDKTNCEN